MRRFVGHVPEHLEVVSPVHGNAEVAGDDRRAARYRIGRGDAGGSARGQWRSEKAAQRAIGAYPISTNGQRAFYLLVLRPGVDLAQLLPNVSPLQRELDVVLLHEGILEPALGITMQAVTKEANLTYEREAANALNAVDSGKAQISLLLNACGVEKVVEIATANEVMPQKSTDFFPKLLSGITMYRV